MASLLSLRLPKGHLNYEIKSVAQKSEGCLIHPHNMMAVENPQIHHLIETNCAAGKDFFANVINENCDQILLLLSNIGNPLPYRIFFFVSSVRLASISGESYKKL